MKQRIRPDVRQVSVAQLKADIKVFEDRYGMSSEEFLRKFNAGEMGDSADVVEWEALLEWIRRDEARSS